MRVRLDVAYDGTAYHGWAAQPGLPTVLGVLQVALATRLGVAEGSVTVSGRTDTGVHATGQVCHFDLPADGVPDDLALLRRRINGLLPDDIVVKRVSLAPPGFDARFSPLARRYTYRVCDDPAFLDPLRRHDTLVWPRPLDVDLLRAASAPLVGEHDFAAFCRRREGATTVRALQRLDWDRCADGTVIATVEADAFCHSMVRSLVGALLAAGDGRRAVDWPAQVLAGRSRAAGVMVAPPHGLTLVAVIFPPDDELTTRAEATRRHRG